MNIITLEAAQALVELGSHIASRFPDASIYDYDPTDLRHSPTGERYTEITQKNFATIAGCIRAARDAFDAYAEGKSGTLYYRVMPELAGKSEYYGPWAFYMRLLISDKPVVKADA
jgi:hypothetical protein